MKFDRLEPCKSCPYRRDAPRKLWAPIEFAKLLADDASQLGKVYGCHQERKLSLAEHRPCVGWAIDQKKRDLPSIAFRILLTKKTASDWYDKLDVKYRGLFRTLAAMCRANGVSPVSKMKRT
jgi:hypothetical protein